MSEATIAFASDHGGYDLKQLLLEDLRAKGFDVLDLGTNGPDSVDYPDYAALMAKAIADGKAGRGVLLCGSGIGISIAANRYPHIRAALVHDGLTARLSRLHNDANVIAMGGRILGIELAKDCLDIFLNTKFEGGRHERRVAKMSHAG
ncbi:MAG TPA: ribose 5-phosphate isomerase B [Alphaproteobacteria bacterium]|nr:ribose 5-phosphate isomerase B [Alphaproteobacteria bacterium]